MIKSILVILSIFSPILLSAQGYFYTEGTVQINNGAAIEIKGNAIIEQPIDGDGLMAMNGTSAQTMGGNAAIMNHLNIENNSQVTLTNSLWVNDSLEINSGFLFLQDKNLYLGDDSYHTGNNSGYIQTNGSGYIERKLDNTGFTFHVGSGNEYFSIGIIESGTADTFQLQAWDYIPDDGTINGNPINTHVALISYRIADNNPGANNLSLNMLWNDSKNAIDFVQPYAVGIWFNGTNYVEVDNCPTNVSNVDPNSILYNGILNTGTFGIGDSIYLSNIPYAAITPGDTSFCEGGTVIYTAEPSGASGYLWNTTANTASIIADTTGTYWVEITDSTGCVYSSENVNLTVFPLPLAPTIIATDTLLSISASYTTYQWYLNGSAIVGANGPTYAISGNGNYSVVVTNSTECVDTSSNFIFNTFGIEDNEGNQLMVTYVNQQIYINMIPDAEMMVYIYDALGKVLHQGPYTNQYIFLLAETGIYIVVLQNLQQTFVQKIILQ